MTTTNNIVGQITLRGLDLQALATVVNACPERPKDEPAEVLNTIRVDIVGNEYHAFATDRYIVANISGKLEEAPAEDFSFKFDRKDIQALAKSINKLELATLELIEADDEFGQRSIRVWTPDTSSTVLEPRGNFPPVERLFPEEPEESVDVVALNINHLTRLNKVHAVDTLRESPANRKQIATRFRFTANGAGKPGPVLLDRRESTFRAIIQPNLLLDSWKR